MSVNLKPIEELCLTDLNLRPHKIEEEDLYTINYIQLNQLENKASGKVPVHNDWVTKVTYIPQLRTGFQVQFLYQCTEQRLH